MKLELIHSNQARSPEGFWYDQEESEWVLLLKGSATLAFNDADELSDVALKEGDSLLIAPHRKHRVEETGPDTIWLALFIK